MKHRLFVLAVGSILVASAAYAHHSFAKDYDEDHVVVTGAPNRVSTEYSVHMKSIRKDDGWSWPSAGDRGFGGRRFGYR